MAQTDLIAYIPVLSRSLLSMITLYFICFVSILYLIIVIRRTRIDYFISILLDSWKIIDTIFSCGKIMYLLDVGKRINFYLLYSIHYIFNHLRNFKYFLIGLEMYFIYYYFPGVYSILYTRVDRIGLYYSKRFRIDWIFLANYLPIHFSMKCISINK